MYLGNKLDEGLKEVSGLVLVYGASASGKSTFAMQSSLQFAKKGRVLFFDTERSFSVDRIKLMTGDYEKLLDNIIVVDIKNFEDQFNKILEVEKMVKNGEFIYVVIDSFGNFYRHALHNSDHIDTNDKVIQMLRNLKHVSKLGIPVLITNQVYSSPITGSENKAVGGTMIRNFSDSILELELSPRKITIHKPINQKISFKINNEGLVV